MNTSAPRTLDANAIAARRGRLVELNSLIVDEWRDTRRLSRRSLLWIVTHADVDDPHPVASTIAALRMTDAQTRS